MCAGARLVRGAPLLHFVLDSRDVGATLIVRRSGAAMCKPVHCAGRAGHIVIVGLTVLTGLMVAHSRCKVQYSFAERCGRSKRLGVYAEQPNWC